jgi:hypothetical protein
VLDLDSRRWDLSTAAKEKKFRNRTKTNPNYKIGSGKKSVNVFNLLKSFKMIKVNTADFGMQREVTIWMRDFLCFSAHLKIKCFPPRSELVTHC